MISNAARIQFLLKIALIIAAVLEVVIEPEFTNLACVAIIFASSWLTLSYILRERFLNDNPLSALMILGFNLTSQAGALIFQAVAIRPVTFNLAVPVDTFATLALSQVTFILAHEAWRRMGMFRRASAILGHAVFKPLGLFRTPTTTQLWMLEIGRASCRERVLRLV